MEQSLNLIKSTTQSKSLTLSHKMHSKITLIILFIAVTTCAHSSDPNDDSATFRAADSDSPEVDQLINSAEPRQYFKLSSSSSSADAGTKGLRRSAQLTRSTTTTPAVQEQPLMKHKITNANLKKLLSQSLLKSNASSGAKSNNFKLLFIQRATAAPISSVSPSKSSGTKTASSSQTQTSTTQPSLAASVSKQLANSLFNSAVSLIDNLDTFGETDKNKQQNDVQVSKSNANRGTESSSSSSSSSSVGVSGSSASDMSDIKRIYTLESKPKGKKSGTKTKQSSKIYNLPVKFVSNGQPNHVVFTALKQHFATIKKIQAATKAVSVSNSQAKRRKQHQVQHKTKGNSRLIYLPLKYLSNARPNRIISSKVTHRQSAGSGS